MSRSYLRHSWTLLVMWIMLGCIRAAFSQAPSTMTLQQCEPDSCGTWSFQGNQGVGKWLTGPTADLTIESFDDQTITIRREDVGGTKGLTGRYTGTRKGSHIEGTFTWTWPGGPYPSGTVNWIATIDNSQSEPERPSLGNLAMCEDAADGCSNWSFQGRDGYGNWSNCVAANLSAVHFDGNTITIRRIDATGAWQGLSALYTGTVNGDQIKGEMSWLWQGHGQYSIGTVPWHATIGVTQPGYNVPVDKAMECGASASAAHNYPMASHWYLYAEREGSLRASVFIGILLVNGPQGIPQDYPDALKRFENAGSKGDTLGMNNAALIYQRGLGVPVSPEKANYWLGRIGERRQQFYPVCSSEAVRRTMVELLADSRNSSGSILDPLIKGLLEEGMHVDLEDPKIEVAAARTTDVISDDDFKCDGVFAPQDNSLVQPRAEADADTAFTAFLASQMMKNLQPVQEFHLKRTGPGQYIVSLESIGSDDAQNGLRMPLPKPFSRPVSLH